LNFLGYLLDIALINNNKKLSSMVVLKF